ncbi:hypothetical protein [Deinococcus sp.]|uniref:hypothetical protein n=1 Tax=Deinococcus sp. TaxID=47478 RepID=UPI002869DC2B|nr:hypothetical protein [Deinococcus sp.]
MKHTSGLPAQGRPPPSAAIPAAPSPRPPPRFARLRRAALDCALLQLIPLGLTTVVALATGVERNPDNLPLVCAALLGSWVLTTALYLWLGREAATEELP